MNSAFRRPPSRHQQLLQSLPVTIHYLERGQSDLIPAGFLEDYVALNWLTHRHEGFRLTPAGEEVCHKLQVAA